MSEIQKNNALSANLKAKTPESKHDKLAFRLVRILELFSEGAKLTLAELAAEFNVSERTIMRDIKERLGFLSIERKGGTYALAPSALGRLGYADLQKFALLSGISRLYPSLENTTLADILNDNINTAF